MVELIDPFHRRLREVLERQLIAEQESLCANSASGIEDYRYRCGRLVAIREIIQECLEIEATLYGGGMREELE